MPRGVNFPDLHDAILETFKDTEIHCAFAEKTLRKLPEARTQNEVPNELAPMSPMHASYNMDQLKDYADTRQNSDVTEQNKESAT